MENNVLVIIAIIIIVAIMVIGATKVYGDTFDYAGYFPIPDNVEPDKIQVMKGIVQVDDTTFEFHIHYKYTAEQVQQWYDELIEKNIQITLPDCEFGINEITGDCLDEIIEPIDSNFVPEKKPLQLTRYEADIIYFETHPPKSTDQLDYFNQLKFLAECQQGLNQSRGIQDERSVIYSEFTVDTTIPSAGHITGNSGDLDLAIAECLGEIEFLRLVGDDRADDDIRSKQSYFLEPQVYHGDNPIYNKEFWASIPTHASDSLKLTDHAFEVENLTAWERMCLSENVSSTFKLQQGCMLDYSVGLNLDGTCRDYTVYNHDKTRCLPEFVERSTSTGIRINADPLYKFLQYEKDDGDQQLNEILMKKLLEEQDRIRIVKQTNE